MSSKYYATAAPTVLHHFGITAIGEQYKDNSFTFTITAQDVNNTTVTDFEGTVEITSDGTLSSGGGTSANFVNGVLANKSVTISNTGTFTITATNSDGDETGESNEFSVVDTEYGGYPVLLIKPSGDTYGYNSLQTAINGVDLENTIIRVKGSIAPENITIPTGANFCEIYFQCANELLSMTVNSGRAKIIIDGSNFSVIIPTITIPTGKLLVIENYGSGNIAQLNAEIIIYGNLRSSSLNLVGTIYIGSNGVLILSSSNVAAETEIAVTNNGGHVWINASGISTTNHNSILNQLGNMSLSDVASNAVMRITGGTMYITNMIGVSSAIGLEEDGGTVYRIP